MPEMTNEIILLPAESLSPCSEQTLQAEAAALEIRAGTLVVSDDQEYQEAAEFARMLKTKAGEITAFFKPMKDSAHKAHKQVCDREKEMLAPLAKAEKVIKQAMSSYLDEQEKRRKAAEASARLAVQAEAEKLLCQAVALEAQGRISEADAIVDEAEIIEEAAGSVAVGFSMPSVKGVSSSRDWEIESIDPAKVPDTVNGSVIRPVDEKAVMRIIRASKGTIQIPGIKYKAATKMSIRRL
jgi:hypothetical protein